MGRQVNLMVSIGCGCLVGRISQSILRAQFLSDLVVDLGDGLLFRNLKEPSSGLFRELAKNLLPIYVTGGTTVSTASWIATTRVSTPAASGIAATWEASTTTAMTSPILLLRLFSLELNGIHDRVCPLNTLERLIQGLFTAFVNTVGENDERFATLVLPHQLIGGKKGCVIKCGAACIGTPASMAIATVVTTVVRIG
jgi:hypothetical protein